MSCFATEEDVKDMNINIVKKEIEIRKKYLEEQKIKVIAEIETELRMLETFEEWLKAL